MLLEKVIEATVDVRNPIDFCADKNRHLMAELQNTYVGRCYKGAFVVRIKGIIQASSCRLSTTSVTGEGSVDVQFLAEVVVFSRWDILVGVEIVSAQQILVGKYKAPSEQPRQLRSAEGGADADPDGPSAKAVVTILASKAVETLAVGQKIAVRVVLAKHEPMQPQASVVGTLLVCDQAAPVYRLRGALDPSARAELEPLLRAIEAELEARAALVETRRADVWFFELLLYAYRPAKGAKTADQAIDAWPGGPAWEGPGAPLAAGAETRSVLDIVRRVVGGATVPVAGIWSRPLALYRSSPLAAVAPADAPADWAPPDDGNPRAVFAEFLKNILDFLAAVREMAELYNTRELIDGHRNLWTVMSSAQKPHSGA